MSHSTSSPAETVVELNVQLAARDAELSELKRMLRQEMAARSRAEEALRQSERRFHEYFELGVIGIAITSLEKGWVEVNERLCETLGYSRDELLTKTWAELTHPDDLERDLTEFNRVLSGEIDGYSIQKRFVHNNGSIVHATISARCIRKSNGEIDYFVALVHDITDLVIMQDRLRHEHDVLQSILNTSVAAIVMVDRDGRITFANKRGEEVLGLARHELTERQYDSPKWGITDLDGGPFDETMLPFNQVIRTGKPVFDVQHAIHFEDGRRRLLSINGAPIRDNAGEIASVVFCVADITERISSEREREHLQRQLLQAQKMEAIGLLAGGVAHDFNNVLTAIMGNAEILARKLPEPPQELEAIQTAGTRAASMTRQLLSFSRNEITQPDVVSLEATIGSMESMLVRMIGEHITLEVHAANGPSTVYADATQLEQVIINLVVNAAEAMPNGGLLTIELSREHQPALTCTPNGADGPFIVMTITDTGTGMETETRARIFEPFFTTKPVGRGSGLGLATVFGAVTRMNGHITVDSAPGHGTCFRIYLPESTEVPAVTDREDICMGARGTETILVCEDDTLARGVVCRTLISSGFHVIEAESGKRAIELAREHHGHLHMLITDVIMPGMNGREVYEALRPMHPRMHTLFMSGYTSDIIDAQGVHSEGVGFLQKPFGPSTLTNRVREILDGEFLTA